MNDNFYKELIDESPIGYAIPKKITVNDGITRDYEFVDVNPSFEEITGLMRSNIVGKNVTEIMSVNSKLKIDWINIFEDIEMNGGKREFVNFSECSQLWYTINIHLSKKHYFVTTIQNVTEHKNLEYTLNEVQQSIKKFPVTLAGLAGVTNLEVITGGYDIETDEELRQRYFDKVSAPVSSGNKYHYINWVKEVTGVGDVKVLPLWNGAGTVKVIIINSNRGVASQSLIDEVTTKIEGSRPIGASITVESAVPLNINVSATLILLTSISLETVIPKIESLIGAYLKRTAFSQDYISYAHIGGAILSVDGVLDYTNLLVNDGTSNIAIDENEVAVLGEVVLT